jgi:Tfp pilus assembly protein PilF
MGNITPLIVIAIIVVCAGLIVWSRRRKQAYTAAIMPQGMSQKELAHNAFVQGNTELSQGEFAKATAAFHQALALDPKHPHAAARLAEVERRQQVAEPVVFAASTR